MKEAERQREREKRAFRFPNFPLSPLDVKSRDFDVKSLCLKIDWISDHFILVRVWGTEREEGGKEIKIQSIH